MHLIKDTIQHVSCLNLNTHTHTHLYKATVASAIEVSCNHTGTVLMFTAYLNGSLLVGLTQYSTLYEISAPN